MAKKDVSNMASVRHLEFENVNIGQIIFIMVTHYLIHYTKFCHNLVISSQRYADITIFILLVVRHLDL